LIKKSIENTFKKKEIERESTKKCSCTRKRKVKKEKEFLMHCKLLTVKYKMIRTYIQEERRYLRHK